MCIRDSCDAGRVVVNDKPAKASLNVKEGDIIEIHFGTSSVKVEVLEDVYKRQDKGRASVFLFDVPCYLCLQMRCVEAAAPAGYERGF